MSYCRWSSDDYQCDVYVYEDVSGGWTTHVASGRHHLAETLPPVELPVGFTDKQFEAWFEREQKLGKIIDRSEVVAIGLPHDGETFNDPTPGECAERLAQLRDLGYNVPIYAIVALLEDDAEQSHGPAGVVGQDTTK